MKVLLFLMTGISLRAVVFLQKGSFQFELAEYQQTT